MTTEHAPKFPWINTGAKTVLFLMKNRIKAPRVVPAPSTGDPAADDTTRREFERVKEQLNADYQDQRNALTDLEPLIYELAQQIQGWMSEKESRLADREERMMNMMLGAARGQALGTPGYPLQLGSGSSNSGSAPASAQDPTGNQSGAAYEGQLLKGEGADAIYKIESGRKRWIASMDALARGFSGVPIRTVPRQIVDGIPFGANIT